MNGFLFGKTLRGVTEGDSVPQRFIPQLIDWWRGGQFPFDRLVSYFSLAQLNEAPQLAPVSCDQGHRAAASYELIGVFECIQRVMQPLLRAALPASAPQRRPPC